MTEAPTGPAQRPRTGMPLYWRVCAINGLVFVLGTAVLALSPATVSARVLLSEAVLLVVGISVILVTNALLLRTSLAPLDRLTRVVESIDVLEPGRRVPEHAGAGVVSQLVRSFNQMLARLEAERGASAARALAAQEAERHRIARELHDEIGQSLTAVLLGLKRAADRAPAELAAELRSVQEIARGGLDDVREVARRLRPGVLEDLGLLSALSALATDLASHTDVQVTRGLSPGLPRIAPEAELVIYRVAQEALTNVARHAHARSVEITLTRQGDGVVLRVADDGRGLAGHVEGSGLRGMRERAALVQGRLQVGPRVDGGTELRLVVPATGAA